MKRNEMDSPECLPELVSPRGAAETAWLTRTHHALTAEFPDRYVFRLGEDLEDLREWMEEAGIIPEVDRLHFAGRFDEDLDGARFAPEGGECRFSWEGSPYGVFSLRGSEDGWDETRTWVVCRDRDAALALVDAMGRRSRKPRSSVLVFEDGDWEEAPRLATELTSYTWDSVILPDSAKTRIRRAADLFFASPGVHEELGIPWKLGFLLVGPPGTGKTLTTKVLANQCGVPFLYVRGLEQSRRGTDVGTVRAIFHGARHRAPCILCLEDVDSLIKENVRSTFLNELDGLEEDYRGVLTVATTNHPERLDAALLHRPSRFDYRFEFPLPDADQRRAFARHWSEKLARLGYLANAEAALDEIVRRSKGMSQAYLKRVLTLTALRMHNLDDRGDAAFRRLVIEELEDAQMDRATAHRAETTRSTAVNGDLGFRVVEN